MVEWIGWVATAMFAVSYLCKQPLQRSVAWPDILPGESTLADQPFTDAHP